MTAKDRAAPLRVHVTGVSDTHNFGDALFPLIAARRLAPLGLCVIPASPTGKALVWPDACPSIPMDRLLTGDEPTDGLLVGGGHLIQSDAPQALFPGYHDSAVPSLWLGASLVAALRNVPIAWNAPGVFGPLIGADLKATAAAAIRLAGYAAVRDQESLAHLDGLHHGAVEVAPDTALDVPAMWPRASLEPVYRDVLARKGVAAPARTLVLHPRGIGVEDAALVDFTARIDAAATAFELTPVLIGVGPTVGDDVSARRVARHLRCRHVLLDEHHALRETAAVLAMADVCMGNSLHAHVVATAYGVPSLLIGKAPARRLRGVVTQLERPQDLFRSWADALDTLPLRLRGEKPDILTPRITAALDRHWARAAAALRGEGPDRTAARDAFIRAYVQLGRQRGGAPWLLAPLASRQMPFGARSAESAGAPVDAG
jgi:hypothetical protein